MTTQQPAPTRQKLTILKVDLPQEVGEKKIPKLAFTARGEDGKELTYFTFQKALFPVLQGAIGKTLDADVVTTSRDYQGNTYIDRKLIQLYQDGQAVAVGQKGQAPYRSAVAGWEAEHGHRLPDAPETRSSIEAQTAYNGAVAIVAAGIGAMALAPDQVSEKLLHWTLWGMEAIQKAKVGGKHTGAVPTQTPQAPPLPNEPGLTSTKPQAPGTVPTRTIPPLKDRGELVAWAKATWNKLPSEVWKARGVKNSMEDNGSLQEIAEFLVEKWGWPEGKEEAHA